MNKHQGFSAKNNQIKSKNSKSIKYFTLASMSALLAACGTSATPTPTITATTGNDVIVLGADGAAGFIDALAGDDKITGGDFADFIRGNTGADTINGGAGVDNIVVVGTTSNASYTLSDIKNPNGVGIDLSIVLELNAVNNNAVSDISDGEVIDGGADGARLFVYGVVDFTNTTLKNITRIDVQSKITFSAAQLKNLIDSGKFQALIGDGTSEIVIEDSGVAVELNFLGIDMQNVKEITVGKNATLLVDQSDIKDIKDIKAIKGEGAIKAVTGTLDVSGIALDSAVTVEAATTPTPTPTPVATNPNDAFAKTSTEMANLTIDGLSGTDTLTITGSLGTFNFTTAGASGANVDNIENIVFGNGGNVITGFDSAVKNVTGGTGVDNITITGMAAGGTIALGDGDDILTALTKTFIETSGTSLKGETGTGDTLAFAALGSAEGVSLSKTSGFEVLTFEDANDSTHAITLMDGITSITVNTNHASEIFNFSRQKLKQEL